MVMSEVLGNLHQNYDEPDSVQFEFPTSLTSESIAQVISMRDKLVNEEKYYFIHAVSFWKALRPW